MKMQTVLRAFAGRPGLRDFWASSSESFGEGLEGLGTEEHGAVGGLDEVKRFLFDPAVEHAGSESGNCGGSFDREHHRLCATFCTVEENSLPTRLQERYVSAFDRDFNVSSVLQSVIVSCRGGVAAGRFCVRRRPAAYLPIVCRRPR